MLTSESEAENDDQSRPGKKLRLSLAEKGKCRAHDQENSERFVSGAKVKILGNKFLPKNTESCYDAI